MDNVRHRQGDGFALTEVLVAAALLAVGLLGHAALVVSALKTERDAAHRATAATLTASMAERIRSNPGAGAAYVLDPDAVTFLPSTSCQMSLPLDAATRAACDLAEWRQEVTNALPGADVSLAATGVADAAATLYTISIRWVSPGTTDPGVFTLWVQA